MRTDEIRKMIPWAPFRPFQVHLADGRNFYIPHPEFISLNPAGRTIVIIHEEGDGWELVDAGLVTSITQHGPQQADPS